MDANKQEDERKAKKQRVEEEVRDPESDADKLEEILSKHYEEPKPTGSPRYYNHRRNGKIVLPDSYGKVDGEPDTIWERGGDSKLSQVGYYFLWEVGWIATHLMFAPYTWYRVITDETICQCLEIMMHPKHWSNTRERLHELIPGWPKPWEPEEGHAVEAFYEGINLRDKRNKAEEYNTAKEKEKDERKRIEESNLEDPDGPVRAAADAGVYLSKILNRHSMGIGGFTGSMAANSKGFDEVKDEERMPLHRFCSKFCELGSRTLFGKLTPEDKAKIDTILGPGYSDLPALLDICDWTTTGAPNFDKVCPLPPQEYRLDAADKLQDIFSAMMWGRTDWGYDPIVTPKAAAILTAALSAALYKAHMPIQETQQNKGKDNEEEDSEGDSEDDGKTNQDP